MKSQMTTIVLLFICLLAFSTTVIEAGPLISNPSPPHYCYDVVPEGWTTDWYTRELYPMLPCQTWATTWGYPGRCVTSFPEHSGLGGECYNECRAYAPNGWDSVFVPEECWWRCGGEPRPWCNCPALPLPDTTLGIHTCQNGGTCDENYTCHCPEGWTGEFCNYRLRAYHWSPTSWSDCDPLPGHAPFPKMCWQKWAHRNVTCLETSTSQVVDDSFCLQNTNEPRPDTSRICHEKRCLGPGSVCDYTMGLCECDEWSYGPRCEYYYSWDENMGDCKLRKPNQVCGQPQQPRYQARCNVRTLAPGMWIPDAKRHGCWETPEGWLDTRNFDCGDYVQCENGGQCDGEQCICATGFTGPRCEERLPEWQWKYSSWSTQCTKQSSSQLCGYQGKTRTATCRDRWSNRVSTQPNVDCVGLVKEPLFKFDPQDCPLAPNNGCDIANRDNDKSWYCIGTQSTTPSATVFGPTWTFSCSTQKSHPNRILHPPQCRNGGTPAIDPNTGHVVIDQCDCDQCNTGFVGERCQERYQRHSLVDDPWGPCEPVFNGQVCGYQVKRRTSRCMDACTDQEVTDWWELLDYCQPLSDWSAIQQGQHQACPTLPLTPCSKTGGKCYGLSYNGRWLNFECTAEAGWVEIPVQN